MSKTGSSGGSSGSKDVTDHGRADEGRGGLFGGGGGGIFSGIGEALGGLFGGGGGGSNAPRTEAGNPSISRADTPTVPLENTSNANAAMQAAATQTAANDPGIETGEDNIDAALIRLNAALEGLPSKQEQDAVVQSIADDPVSWLNSQGLNLSARNVEMFGGALGTTLDPSNPAYGLNYSTAYRPATYAPATINAPVAKQAQDVTTASSLDQIMQDKFQVDPVTGEVSDNALVDSSDVEADVDSILDRMEGPAQQNFSRLIDTSTASGKLLAEALGEGNYTDTKATILGQMDIISKEFKDANGNLKIPTWAQSTARNVSRTIAFNGVSGTAAKAAVANAMMESSLGIAEREAQFFQTLTVKNLDNRQQSAIQKAQVLASLELENLSAREAAAVNNARAFLQMDLTNVENRQQAEMVNKQARIDALFTTTAEENVNRRLNITNDMDMAKFYDSLSFQAETFMAESLNASLRFNADAENAANQFTIEQEARRQSFEANMQFQIDSSNARWRQAVETTNTSMDFEFAAADVRNALNLSQEAMNRIWDRVDAQLDYVWQSSENDTDRDFQLMVTEMQAEGAREQAKQQARGSIMGSLIGGAASIIGSIFSDIRFKKNIRAVTKLDNGIQIYSWDWTDEALEKGCKDHPTFGVIAQEIQKTHPHAVFADEQGYLGVDYRELFE